MSFKVTHIRFSQNNIINSVAIAYSNAAIAPILYLCLSKRSQKSLCQFLCHRKGRLNHPHHTTGPTGSFVNGISNRTSTKSPNTSVAFRVSHKAKDDDREPLQHRLQ